MKNWLKKDVSMLIAVAMIGSIPSVSAFATDISEVDIISENFKSERPAMEGKTRVNPYESAYNALEDGDAKTELLSLLSELNEIKEEKKKL